LPREDFKQVLVIVAIAAAISIAALFDYNYTVFADHQETVAQIEEIINRDVTLDLPAMRDYAGRSNDDIIGSFNAAGYTLYDNTSEEDWNAGGFDMYKLASDVTTEEAAAAYSQGLDKIDPGEAAKVLSGSWRFLVDRANGNEMRLRYIDFDATTPTTALNDAVAAQAFDAAQASAPTEDSLGNTNVTGTFEKDGKTYEDGEILDPKNGKVYGCEVWREGKNLIVRGKIAFFGRNQTWLPNTTYKAPEDSAPPVPKKPRLK
jgi:hypothetical protein